jgi:hypothetical protein
VAVRTQNPGDYTTIHTASGHAAVLRAVLLLERTLTADGSPAQAKLVRIAFLEFEREVLAVAQRTAVLAEAEVKAAEIGSRVRPDSGGGGDARLNPGVGRSTALRAVPGSVGVNHEDSNVDWWWTNEFGYAGHIGRRIQGYFFNSGFAGASAPDPSRFREHPLFQMGKGGPKGGKGRRGEIRKPIPDRHFVRDGANAVEPGWRAGLQAAERRLVDRCRAAKIASDKLGIGKRRRQPRRGAGRR